MLSVVLVAADEPVVGLHGLLATGEVLLSDEGLLVASDLGEILAALVHHLRYGREAHTCEEFVLGRAGTAFGFLAQVQAVTIRVLSCRYAVGSKQHLGTTVLAVLTGFTQCAGNGIDTGTPIYFCHGMFGVCRTDRPAD